MGAFKSRTVFVLLYDRGLFVLRRLRQLYSGTCIIFDGFNMKSWDERTGHNGLLIAHFLRG